MYSKTTCGVTVTVTPYFLEDQSSPQENHYVWAYQVNIKNISSTTVRLNHRNWLIIDANGKIINVQGDGVVGEIPMLKQGESYEYTSGTPLKTSNGISKVYLMTQDSGEQIKIDIPTFLLIALIAKKVALN